MLLYGCQGWILCWSHYNKVTFESSGFTSALNRVVPTSTQTPTEKVQFQLDMESLFSLYKGENRRTP